MEMNFYSKTVFAGHGSKVAHMDSQYLGTQTQNLLEIKPAQIPTWMGKMFSEPHLSLWNYWHLIATRRERVSFLLGYRPREPPHTLVGGSLTHVHPDNIKWILGLK